MAKKLMEKYQDLPMDFADATLGSLAHDLPIDHVVTFDRKDFGIYRLQKNDLLLSSPKERGRGRNAGCPAPLVRRMNSLLVI